MRPEPAPRIEAVAADREGGDGTGEAGQHLMWPHLPHLVAARVDQLALQKRQIVGRHGSDGNLGIIQQRIGPQCSVHGRNGDSLAAKEIEKRIEQTHVVAPQ